MTKEEAIADAVQFAERYNLEWQLLDGQAIAIGRRLWENLRQARIDEQNVYYGKRGLKYGDNDRIDPLQKPR